MRRIIAHEIIHIKQYHTFDILLIELITVLQWFNPFVWPYKKSLQETHEFLADNGVIAQGFSTAKYQLLMFEQHVGVKLFELVNNFKQSQIKRRITMMSKIKSRGTAKLKLLLIVPMAAFLLLAFAEPKAADTPVVKKAAISTDQDTDQKKKEKQLKMDQVKATLADLKKEEMMLREKMDATDDPQKKADIKSHLKDVLLKEKVWAEVLASGVLPPPKNEKKLKQEYKLDDLLKQYTMLEEKAEDLRKQMKNTDDPDVKAKCKQMLSEIQKK